MALLPRVEETGAIGDASRALKESGNALVFKQESKRQRQKPEYDTQPISSSHSRRGNRVCFFTALVRKEVVMMEAWRTLVACGIMLSTLMTNLPSVKLLSKHSQTYLEYFAVPCLGMIHVASYSSEILDLTLIKGKRNLFEHMYSVPFSGVFTTAKLDEGGMSLKFSCWHLQFLTIWYCKARLICALEPAISPLEYLSYCYDNGIKSHLFFTVVH
ncbi:hypothetical protein STEG23_026013, partial [Scotinomys teguina]